MYNKIKSKTVFFSMAFLNSINLTFLLMMFLFAQPFVLFSMEQQEIKNKEIVLVYSHGFGEMGGAHGPTYPDAPAKLSEAVFYTRPAVICLAKHLHYQVNQQGNAKVHLLGRSCGAGIAINCLYKLINYDPVYFQATGIAKNDARNIVAAINNGALELTVPFLSITKAKIIDTSTTLGGYGFATASVGAALYLAGAPSLPAVGLASTLYGSYKLIETIGSLSKFASNDSIDEYVVPSISNQHYDSKHLKPIHAVQGLSYQITCPTLLHFCKNDGVLANPDEDTIKVYQSLRAGNEQDTYIILTDDDSHNCTPSNGQYNQCRKRFKAMVNGQKSDMSEYQPTVEQLRYMIFPSIWNMTFKREV